MASRRGTNTQCKYSHNEEHRKINTKVQPAIVKQLRTTNNFIHTYLFIYVLFGIRGGAVG